MSGAAFKVELDDAKVQRIFARLTASASNLTPLFAEIGSALEESTRQRFTTERAPDGQPWEPIDPDWLATKKARGFNAGILKMRGDLANSIHYEASSDYVEIIAGPTEYAAVHQFGGQAGRRGASNLPARPFLGVSDDDLAEIRDAADSYLEKATRGG